MAFLAARRTLLKAYLYSSLILRIMLAYLASTVYSVVNILRAQLQRALGQIFVIRNDSICR
jgi:hypothetical protein